MQKCFLVINKENQIGNYLQHRSILEVTEEHRSLTELNLDKLDIVDVDKFLYIYYQTDDGDLSFRADMNALRTLLSSAFFHVSEAVFLLVSCENPLLEDLIHSALRDSPLPKSKIDIIHHDGTLMFSDIGKYMSGSASGQSTTSSYRDVYIREADKEEKERYSNTSGGIDAVLPVLTDMAALYSQRSSVEAISSGRIVVESQERPQVVKDFTRVNIEVAKTIEAFVVSGERWTKAERAVRYIIEYDHLVGKRCLVVNLDLMISPEAFDSSATILEFIDIKTPVTAEQPVAVISGRFNQLSYIIEFLHNIKGAEQYIFYVSEENYRAACRLIAQLTERVYFVFVGHYTRSSVERYLSTGVRSTALYLCFEIFQEEFNLKAYKSELSGTIVASFPTDDVDYVEFFSFATGGGQDD